MKLLKDILDTWKTEVEKKPPTLSLNEALVVLKLEPDKKYVYFNIYFLVFVCYSSLYHHYT